MELLHHFSEDAGIARFVPHVPATNPGHAPAVWAIDAEHAPAYWFPRDCARVTVWPATDAARPGFAHAFATAARRVHAIEGRSLAAMRTSVLYRYDLPATSFRRWPAATGQWIAEVPVEPAGVEPIGDLLELHASAGIELRVVPSIWPLVDLVSSRAQHGSWDFSIIRAHLATPRG